MSPLVYITMFGWIPFVLSLFTRFKPRHAVIIAFLTAWLFLPVASFPVKGLPDYTKMSATCCGVILGAFIFDNKRILLFRPKIVDLPMILWCLCPIASSLSNDLGLYDGVSEAFNYIVIWGFPFFIGRIYFSSLKGLKEYASGILIGGMIYIPLCLFENRMSPHLHAWVYGYMQRSFGQTIRWGGYRPMVFMEHGLMVGTWMMSATLSAFWLWITGTIRKIGSIPIKWIVLALFFTSVMTRSTGAIALLAVGMGTLFIGKKINNNLLVVCLLLIPILYMGTRGTGVWTGYNLQEFIANTISYERAESLWFRMENENILTEKALQRPAFGWGGWGRSRVHDEEGKDITVTDGLWIIILGQNGLAGLGLFTLSLLMPVAIFLRRYPVQKWHYSQIAPAAVLSILLGLYMIDNLLNAMVNPIFTVVAGGLTGIAAGETVPNKKPRCQVKASHPKANAAPRFL